jgi:hypothetical protein
MDRIHINTARKILDTGEPVSLEFVTQEGDWVRIDDAVCISSYFRGGYRRMRLPNGFVRTVRDCTIVRINDMEVYL